MLPPPQRTESDFELELPVTAASVTRARQAITDYVRSSAPAVGEDDVALAVSEAVGNAVLHAFRNRKPGSIVIGARPERGRLIVTVTDDGSGMRPTLGGTGLGVGIGLMREVSDELRLESSGKGTTAWMAFDERGIRG